MGKKICKTCGNLFTPKSANDRYCSSLCRAAGCFLGGGGDTTKPNSGTMQKAKPEKTRHVKSSSTDYRRVHAMLELPMQERWKVSRDFTEEERAYARRLARKSLMDERAADCISDWDCGDNEDNAEIITDGVDRLGESDDGSI